MNLLLLVPSLADPGLQRVVDGTGRDLVESLVDGFLVYCLLLHLVCESGPHNGNVT